MNPARTTYLDFIARLNQAFRPFAPIDLPDFFTGRNEEIQTLVREIRTPGRQVAVYGERGVGKTSLTALAYFFADCDDRHTFVSRCASSSTYDSIFGEILHKAGIGYLPNGMETESAIQGGIAAVGSVAGARTTRARHQAIGSTRTIGPETLLRHFGGKNGLLIIDEYDRVQDRATHIRIAETLKHFSDAASRTKIIVVGVAETISELLGEHQSLTRCLAQIKLDRMREAELLEIIATGERRVGAVFKDSVKHRIVSLADGFPFYVHLLCKYCAEDAGQVLENNPGATVVVADKEYHRAVRQAVETAEAELLDDYQAAVVTVKRKTEMFKNILWGIAYSESKVVQVKEIAEHIEYFAGTPTKPAGFSSHLGKLASSDKRRILTRVREGHYKFTNPLMRAYVRLILENHNLMEENGQMQFPWMKQMASEQK